MNQKKTWLRLGITAALIAAAIFIFKHWGYGSMFGSRELWPMSQWGHGGMMTYGGSWGMGIGMGIGMLLFWGLIIFGIVSLITGAFSRSGQDQAPMYRADDPLEILKKRYARGEIDKAEFDAKRRDLNV